MKLHASLFASILLTADIVAAAEQDAANAAAGLRSKAPDVRHLSADDRLTGEVIVSRKSVKKLKKEGKSDNEIKELREKGLKKIKEKNVVKESKPLDPDEDDFQVVAVGKGNEAAYIAELMAANVDSIEYAEANTLEFPVIDSNDPNRGNQWHHVNMKSQQAWDIETGSVDITIGICDTGEDLNHDDLKDNRLEGYNSVSGLWEFQGGAVTNVHPHGTNCAGCPASIGDNGVGIAGVGWYFKHRPGRVTDSSTGSASSSSLADCARKMCEKPDVKVVSVSYSGVEGTTRRSAATYCKSQGALMVNAAGNDNRDLSFVGNADADDLIVAAASDSSDNKASFSAYGSFVDVWAPGVSVYTTEPGGGYRYTSGTSFSCPLTAGVIAMIWSRDPSLTPDEVEAILKSSSDTGVGNIMNYGTTYGRIDTFAAVSAVTPPGPTTNAPTNAPTEPQPTNAPTSEPTNNPTDQCAPKGDFPKDGDCGNCCNGRGCQGGNGPSKGQCK